MIDFLLLICSITMLGIPAITRYLKINGNHSPIRIHLDEFFDSMTPYVYSFALSFQTASVYLTVTITIERFLAVCYPFKARECCTRGLMTLKIHTHTMSEPSDRFNSMNQPFWAQNIKIYHKNNKKCHFVKSSCIHEAIYQLASTNF